MLDRETHLAKIVDYRKFGSQTDINASLIVMIVQRRKYFEKPAIKMTNLFTDNVK